MGTETGAQSIKRILSELNEDKKIIPNMGTETSF